MKGILKGLFFYEADNCTDPLTDVYETVDHLVFEVDLPGADLADVSVMVYENLLIIDGARGVDEPQDSELKYLCMERSSKRFRRILNIPVCVNAVAADAFYSKGVLIVRFPKLKGKLLSIDVQRR